jgi:small subunit ribosomal protein S17
MTTESSKQKSLEGRVFSGKMEKTVVVIVETRRPHPLYKKVVKKTKKYKVHDELGTCSKGDVVRIEETRPLSKEKRWRVAEILRKGDVIKIESQEVPQESKAEAKQL